MAHETGDTGGSMGGKGGGRAVSRGRRRKKRVGALKPVVAGRSSRAESGEWGGADCLRGDDVVTHVELRGDWREAAFGDESITSGYRKSSSWGGALRSLFQCHNEALNIWTHLVGALVFCTLLLSLLFFSSTPHSTLLSLERSTYQSLHSFPHSASEAWKGAVEGVGKLRGAAEGVGEWHEVVVEVQRRVTELEREAENVGEEGARAVRWWVGQVQGVVEELGREMGVGKRGGDGGAVEVEVLVVWPLVAFIVSATVCLSASVAFHWFSVINPYWYKVLAKLDYGGIAVLILGSQFPPLQYLFYCHPFHAKLYTAISTASCITAGVAAVGDCFSDPKWRATRAFIFILTGLVGGGAVLSVLSNPALMQFQDVQRALSQMATMGALYIVGALLYAFKIPERFAPGKFDLLLASHQIFHVCVFAAALLHYDTCILLYQWRSAHMVCTEELE